MVLPKAQLCVFGSSTSLSLCKLSLGWEMIKGPQGGLDAQSMADPLCFNEQTELGEQAGQDKETAKAIQAHAKGQGQTWSWLLPSWATSDSIFLLLLLGKC